jgi:lysozyme family protein
MSFEAAHAFVARWEGGFVDDPHDRGGATKWGVTIRTLIAKGLDLNNDGTIDRRDIRDMTPAQALDIYRRDYWIGAVCPPLPAPLALLQFDCAVNQGPGRAARILQKSVGARVDGIIGPATLAAVERAWDRAPARLLGEYCARRAVHYSSLSQVVRYGLGWFRRLFDAQRAALAELRGEGG